MPGRAISRPIAWKTHAKISIPTRSACNQIKQDQRLDLAIPITLPTAPSTPVRVHLASLRPLLFDANPPVPRCQREQDATSGERRRGRTNIRTPSSCTLPLCSVSLYLRASRCRPVYSDRYGNGCDSSSSARQRYRRTIDERLSLRRITRSWMLSSVTAGSLAELLKNGSLDTRETV